MILGGEMSKISHGVGRCTVAIFIVCAMWRFFFENPTPSPGVRGECSSMETMMLEGKMAHHGGDVCVLVFS